VTGQVFRCLHPLGDRQQMAGRVLRKIAVVGLQLGGPIGRHALSGRDRAPGIDRVRSQRMLMISLSSTASTLELSGVSFMSMTSRCWTNNGSSM